MLLSYRHAYQKHLGITFPTNEEEFRGMIAMRLAESSATYGGEYAEQVAESYNQYYSTEAYKTGVIYLQMRETLLELSRRGYAVGVVSNKSRPRVSADIDYLNMRGVVDNIVTSEDTPERKPHPAPLLKGAEKLGLRPAECAYIGDYEGDIIAAKAAGMVSVAALWAACSLRKPCSRRSRTIQQRNLKNCWRYSPGIARPVALSFLAFYLIL